MNSIKYLRTNPEIPPELKEAALDGKLILFVGAGASMLVGMPSWSELARKALENLREINAIDFAELEQLKKLDPKKQLSIAELIAQDHQHDLKLEQYLKANRNSPIYQIINSIGATCVTTNYDHQLTPKNFGDVDPSQPRPLTKRISGAEDLKAADLKEPGTVIHLHGDMEKPETMIVTTREYLKHYDNEHVKHFLKELFQNNVVLFIGYGLEEAEILEHILRRGEARNDNTNERKWFALQAFFNSEQPLYNKLIEYYEKSFGVHVIGYTRDDKDYNQLEKVMADWGKDLEVRPPALTEDIADIDRILADE